MNELRFHSYKTWWIIVSVFSLFGLVALWWLSKEEGDGHHLFYLLLTVVFAVIFGITYYHTCMQRGYRWARAMATMGLAGLIRTIPDIGELEDAMDWGLIGFVFAVKATWTYLTYRLFRFNKQLKTTQPES